MTKHFENGDAFSAVSETVVDVELDEDAVNFNLSTYEEDEIAQITAVMITYKTFYAEEKQRKKKLETSLEKSIMSIEIGDIDSGMKFCIVCHEKFTLIMKRRKICSLCQKGVCISCSWKFKNKKRFVCQLCYMKRTRDGMTGKWFHSLSRSNGRHRKPAVPILMNAIRKAKEVPEPVPQEHGKSKGTMNQLLHLAKKGAPMLLNLPFIGNEVDKLRGKTLHAINVAMDGTEDPDGTDGNLHSAKKTFSKLLKIPIIGKKIDHLQRKTMHTLERAVDAADDVFDGVGNGEEDVLMRDAKNDFRRLASNGHSNLESMSSMASSAISVCSEFDESFNHHIPISGDISLSIFYDEKSQFLRVFVEKCRNIAVADRRKGRTDPYIKTYLLPDKNKVTKKKSNVKKMTINPEYEETMSYYIEKGELASKTLSVSVWHKSSMIIFNVFLGEVQFVLSDVDLTSQTCNWYSFHDKRSYLMRPGGVNFKGDLNIKLKFKSDSGNSNRGSLHVSIIGIKNIETELPTLNSYVKCYLLPDKDPKSKKKTIVCKNSICPIWNTLLTFPNVSLEELHDRSLEVSIFHLNIVNMSEFLCGVRINLGLGQCGSEDVHWMDACGKERELWEQCLSSPDEYCETVLNMRSNVNF